MSNETSARILTQPKNSHVILLLMLIPFLMGIGVDLYVPSLPAIAQFYQVGPHVVQYTIALYMLGYGVGQAFLGVVSDSFGRRKVMIASGVLYTLVCLLSTHAPNIGFLILFRILQGLAIAGLGAVCRAVATDCFAGKELTKAMTYLSSCWALGPILGPFIGGYLQYYYGWQADFYFFGIYGLIVLTYIVTVMPETNRQLQPWRLSSIFKAITTMLSHPLFLCGSLILSMVYAALVVFNVIGPFLIQTTLHYSSISYGRIALFLGLSYFLGNISNRWLIDYMNSKHIILVSMLSAFASAVTLLLVNSYLAMNLYSIIIPVFCLFYCCGLLFPNIMAKCIGLFPQYSGTASAIFGSCVAIGVSIMSSIATMLKTSSITPLATMYVITLACCLLLLLLSKGLSMQK